MLVLIWLLGEERGGGGVGDKKLLVRIFGVG